MSALTDVFESYPQLLRNVPANGAAAMEHASVKSAVSAAEAKLGDDGRVLIRPSGTEPVIRVMAEGRDQQVVTAVVDEIAGAIADVPAA